MSRSFSVSRVTGVCLAAVLVLAGSSLQSGSEQAASIPNQGPDNNYGVSGGNVNDISKRLCCSGTLGSLVTNGTDDYILRNNHLLPDSDPGHVGEAVSQPRLVDPHCTARGAPLVRRLHAWALQGNDAGDALARHVPGRINPPVAVGGTAAVARTPPRPGGSGRAVERGGRPTGVTAGCVQSVSARGS